MSITIQIPLTTASKTLTVQQAEALSAKIQEGTIPALPPALSGRESAWRAGWVALLPVLQRRSAAGGGRHLTVEELEQTTCPACQGRWGDPQTRIPVEQPGYRGPPAYSLCRCARERQMILRMRDIAPELETALRPPQPPWETPLLAVAERAAALVVGDEEWMWRDLRALIAGGYRGSVRIVTDAMLLESARPKSFRDDGHVPDAVQEGESTGLDRAGTAWNHSELVLSCHLLIVRVGATGASSRVDPVHEALLRRIGEPGHRATWIWDPISAWQPRRALQDYLAKISCPTIRGAL